MVEFRDLLKLILLALACLGLVTACQPKEEETAPPLPLVTLIADGQERRLRTGVETVGDLLAETGVELGDLDRVEPSVYTAISDGLSITIVRVRHETVTAERVIPYEKQVVHDTSLSPDESRIIEAGQNGLEQLIYQIVYHDGVEVERVQIRRVTLQEARPETMLVGVRDTFTPTPITGTIAYLAGNKELGYNVWVMRDSSGSQLRLTSDGSLDTRIFALSPSGTRLLFTRRTSETVASEQLNSLWLLDTAALDAEPVELGLVDVLWADWAPDGTAIAYSTGAPSVGAPGWRAHNDLWTAELNVRSRSTGPDTISLVRRRQVAEPSAGGAYGWWGTRYNWSPDGRYIAYAQADSIGFIRLHDGQRTELRHFAPFRTYSQWWVWVPHLSWSPDSRFLTSVVHGLSTTDSASEDSPVFDVWVFDIKRPLAVQQVNEAGMWAAPTWSLTYPGTVDERYSSQIAFARARSPYESATSPYDLYVMDRDGSNRRRIYPAEGGLGLKEPQIAWGPTGKQLLAVDQNDLFLIDLSQDLVKRLTVDGNVQYPVWKQ